MSYVNKKQKANPLMAGNLQTEKNTLTTLEYTDIFPQSQRTPDFRFIKIREDPTILKFTKVYTNGVKIYVRTNRLPKPIGGKFGTVIILNPQTNKIESARFADWYEWAELRDSLNLSRIERQFDYVEIQLSGLAKALGVKI